MRKIIIILLSLPQLLFAQDFRLDVSATQAEVNERIALQYSFDKGGLPENILPKVDNMIMVATPAEMSGRTEFNGVVTNTTQLTFEVVFTKPGIYTIPPVRVIANKVKYTSNGITIKIVKGYDSAPLIPDPYVGKEMLLVSEPNKRKLYVEEPVAMDLIIYSYFLAIGHSRMVVPTFDAGWSKEVEDIPPAKMEPGKYQGKNYYRGFMGRIWMIPSILGEITYKPIQATFHAGLKHEKAGYCEFTYGLQTDPIIFEVQDLPTENKPPSFVNGVGDFTWDLRLDKTSAKANEPIKVILKIRGSGNFPTLQPPVLNLPEDFESFEPTSTDSFYVAYDGIQGSKSFQYLIMPREEGDYILGPFSFSYFNPQTQSYTELKSDSFRVNIKGMVADTTTGKNVVNNGKLEGGSIWKKSNPFFGNPLYYVLLSLPFLAGLGMIIFRKKLFFTKKDDSEKKLKHAEEKANKGLAEARGSVDKLSAVFYQYIGDKFKTTKNDITRANLEKWMPDANTKTLSIKIMDLLDQFRFAPAAASDMDSLYNNIKTLVDELGGK